MPVIPRNVGGHVIHFVVGDSVVWPPISQVFHHIPSGASYQPCEPDTSCEEVPSEAVPVTFPDSEEFHRRHARLQMTAAELIAGIDTLVEALGRIPDSHLGILGECPILITTNLPSGAAPEHGGYYKPLGAAGSPLYTVQRWIDRADRTHLPFPPADRAVAHGAGLIAITTRNLKARPLGGTPRCQFTVLHETGHCIDYNGDPSSPGHGLDSNPPDTTYRLGNHPYQGQKYPAPRRPGEEEEEEDEEPRLLPLGRRIYEFKAETYSRLFVGCTFLCRQGDAEPPCLVGRDGHLGCNRRLQLDLAHSPAFRGLLTYLPLAAPSFRAPAAGSPDESTARFLRPVQEGPLRPFPSRPAARGRDARPTGIA